MAYIYDAGALVAAERRDQTALIRHRAILTSGTEPLVPITVLAQVWRDGARQAQLARLLKSCEILSLEIPLGRAAGELCGRSGTADIVDATVVLTAGPGDTIYTSDPNDLAKLLANLSYGHTVEVITV